MLRFLSHYLQGRLVFPLAELPELARGQGVTVQRYRDGGLSDAIFAPARFTDPRILALIDKITAADIMPRHLRRGGDTAPSITVPPGATLADTRRQLVLRAFASTNGDYSRTATIVGMTPADVRAEIASLLNGSEGAGGGASSTVNGAHRPVKAAESPASASKSPKQVSKGAKAKKR